MGDAKKLSNSEVAGAILRKRRAALVEQQPWLTEQISIATAKANQRRERRSANRPTPERLAKGDLAVTPRYAPSGFVESVNYAPRELLKRYEKGWPPAISNAFEQFVIDRLSVGQGPTTFDYEKISNRTYGCSRSSSPTGGVGMSETRRRAAHRDHFVMTQVRGAFDLADGIPVLHVLEAVLLRIERDAFGQRFTLADIGRHIFPALRDEATARGVAIGSLTMVGRFLASCYMRYWADHGPR